VAASELARHFLAFPFSDELHDTAYTDWVGIFFLMHIAFVHNIYHISYEQITNR